MARNEKKRKAEEAFHQCTGMGVADSSVRKIIARLQKNDDPTPSYSRSSTNRYAHIADCIRLETVKTESGEVELYMTNLEKYLQIACTQYPIYGARLKEMLQKELENNVAGVPGVIYVDECVPGNILAPDNRRKSYLAYFTYVPCSKYRSLHYWWPLALLRHSEVDQLVDGLPQWFTRLLHQQVIDLGSLMLCDMMIPISKVYFIADEAAIKLACGSKGASGMRPCLHCDAFSKEREDMAQSLGCAAISCADFNCFHPVTDGDVLKILKHLQHIRNNESRAALAEAEKLLGWTLRDNCCFLDETVALYLQPSQCHYGAMHCYWSNGQVNCEVGLFFTEAIRLGHVTRPQLENFMDIGWKKTSCIGGALSPASLKSLVNAKILKEGSDFRGDASQCLDILPLLSFFADSTLAECIELRPHVKSLVALHHVCAKILHAKNNVENVGGLRDLQTVHLQLFVDCYGKEKVRPKHHIACHIEEQSLECGVVLDCFVGERKNKCFKNVLCPMVSKLHRFEKSILLRFLETDLNNLESYTGNQILLKNLLDSTNADNTKIAKALSCEWGEVKSGHIFLLNDHEATQVVGCMQRRSA